MEFVDFAGEVELTKKATELLKAEHIAYFLLREQKKIDFTVKDLLSLWQQLPISQPNSTRLRDQMAASGHFPRSPTPKHFRLHADTVRACDEAYPALWTRVRRAPKSGSHTFVHVERVKELRSLAGARPDVSRLIRLCEEINTCYEQECVMAVALLARTVINHVPPCSASRRSARWPTTMAVAQKQTSHLSRSRKSWRKSHEASAI
jgi:hypothetical protein